MRSFGPIELSPTEQFLDRHLREAGTAELRTINPRTGKIHTGIFNNPGDLRQTILRARSEANCYLTTQRPTSSVCPPNNVITPARRGEQTRDSDIESFVRLPFDFDVEKEFKVDNKAPPEQVDSALEVAMAVRRHLTRMGWPLPALVSSGNGWHLIYRTPPIPNTAETKELLKLIYLGLDREFSTDLIGFDTTVRNASRIMRVPGSWNLKGLREDPPEVTVKLPPRWGQVLPQQLEKLAKFLGDSQPAPAPRQKTGSHAQPRDSSMPSWIKRTEAGGWRIIINYKPLPGNGDYNTLNIIDWFQSHGSYIRHLEDNKHSVRCPWSHEHSPLALGEVQQSGDTIIFEADGSWPGFFCHHRHCEDKRIGDVLDFWPDADRFCARDFTPGAMA